MAALLKLLSREWSDEAAAADEKDFHGVLFRLKPDSLRRFTRPDGRSIVHFNGMFPLAGQRMVILASRHSGIRQGSDLSRVAYYTRRP
jgi:hypothetical protein